MSDPTTPPELIAQLREAAVLCGVDEEFFAADYLSKAADALAEMCVDLAVTTAYAERAKEIITSVQAELLAGGSPARLRAIVGLIDKETPTNERS